MLVAEPVPGFEHRTSLYTEIADWLNKLGYSAFVLQYRIPDKKEGALQDAVYP